MGNEKQKSDKKRRKIIPLLIVIIVFALVIEAGVLYYVNNRNANNTSTLLLNQVTDIMNKNQKNEKDLIGSLKEDYIVRAKAIAYMIDAKPEAENDEKELQKIADLMSIDEIHLIDQTGKIYSGSVPKYYGYDFNSGDQIAYFKPMLKDKKLTMCQDMVPNTTEGKMMMYAITWNEAGDRMIQVGIEPKRLLKELKQNEAKAVVSNMPVYKGISIYVADKDSGKIYGATDKTKIGKTLDSIGISKKNIKENKTFTKMIRIDGKKSKCVIKKTKNYVVSVTYAIASDNTSNMIAILIVAVYLSIAAGCILFMMSRLSKVKKEKNEQSKMLSSMSEISNTDKLTGCLNRRAYEDDIKNISNDVDFIYISMDVNGLKIINDSMGHAAGDELLTGAASCIKECFVPYGKVYRIGGDEFVTILFHDLDQFTKMKEQFEHMIHHWSGERLESISVSYGCVSSKEREWVSMKEVANVADVRMYEEKAMYYKKNGIDRRGQPEAYVALYKLYSHIIKINLDKDIYKKLNWKEDKQEDHKQYNGRFSEWLEKLENQADIYQDDLEEYRQKMNLEYLRRYFMDDQKTISISYRKKDGDEYKRISIEIVQKEQGYSDEKEYFLYMKGSE